MSDSAGIDLARLTKRIELPEGFAMPRHMSRGAIHFHALAREDLDDDVAGINESLDVIARTRGGGWPEGPVDREFNYVDLVWHEQEFREGESFAYVVRDEEGAYLGCAYLYPLGRRTPLSEELLAHDVDVSWWVTAAAYERGKYERVHDALRQLLEHELPFANPWYSNAEIPG